MQSAARVIFLLLIEGTGNITFEARFVTYRLRNITFEARLVRFMAYRTRNIISEPRLFWYMA